jgi:hypothetical protein
VRKPFAAGKASAMGPTNTRRSRKKKCNEEGLSIVENGEAFGIGAKHT